jgi:phenylacetate 2-hydroxylase
MLQAAAETISGTLTCGIGSLCADEAGHKMQEAAHAAILSRWGSPQEAFNHAFEAEDIPIVVALYKEILRYYAVAVYALPRIASKDIELKNGAVIPKGTTLYMNSENANHGIVFRYLMCSNADRMHVDASFYGADATQFNPDRWLDELSPLPKLSLPHFGYGAGARICPAWQISNRILYGLIVRLIVSFRFTASLEAPPITDYVKYNGNAKGALAHPKPYLAYCHPREWPGTAIV